MRRLIQRAALLAGACLVLMAAIPDKPRVAFSAPAADQPTGKLAQPFAAVLPNGSLVRPAGRSLTLAQHPLALALADGGKYALVAGAGIDGGAGLAVIDLAAMRPIAQSAVRLPATVQDVAVLRDVVAPGADRPAATHELVVAAVAGKPELDLYDLAPGGTLSTDATPAIALPSAPEGASALVVGAHGKTLYAIGSGGAQRISIAMRSPIGDPVPVGIAPVGATRAGTMLAVVNEGVPADGRAYDPSASSISLLRTGTVAPVGLGAMPLDGSLDPLVKVGGVQPSAISAAANGTFFVSLANADRVDVLQTSGWSPRYRRVASIDLSLYHHAPFGTAPDALALAPGGKQLYAALAGIDAVAVIDVANPKHPRRLGLLPTGWFPSALAFAHSQGALVVANALGDGTSGTLQVIPLSSLKLGTATLTALRAVRVEHPIGSRDPVVPQAPALGKSRFIDHLVVVEVAASTYDATFGDLQDAAGDPADTVRGARVTPNLHALAARYAIAANLYAASTAPAIEQAAALGGSVSVAAARRAIAASNDFTALARDDFPRFGFLYNDLARHHMSFRIYGDASWLAILAGKDDPAFLAARGDMARAHAFIDDYGALAAAGQAPAFVSVRLSGSDPSAQDHAVGAIVAALSQEPIWARTVVIVAPRGVDGKDHVDPLRAYALIVGPHVKPHYVGHLHLSYASLLKTEEEILGLPALSLGDLLSSDLAGFFTMEADATRFVAVGSSRADSTDQGASQGLETKLP